MTELGIFARHWTPGHVKTRLAATIGAQQAARIYFASLQAMVKRFQCTADRRVIVFTPHDAQAAFFELAGNPWQLRPQCAGDLGARMHDYFCKAFQSGRERVVLIGSDSPTLPMPFVEQAWEALRRVPVVLGPAEDGGYYLVGMTRPIGELFQGIAWSTSQVWQQTIERLHVLSLPFETLPAWHDFDTLADVQRLRDEVQALLPTDKAYALLAAELANILPESES